MCMKKLLFALMLFTFIPVNANWRVLNLPPDAPTDAIFSKIWTNEAGKLFVVVQTLGTGVYTSAAVYHYDGNWMKIFELQGNYYVNRLFGTSATDVFMLVRDNTNNISEVYHYDGNEFTAQPIPALGNDYPSDIDGESGNVYIIAGTRIFRYDGNSWSLSTTLTHSSGLLTYINANEIYALQCWGHTLWDGSTWTWYGGFDFCDVSSSWGMRDSNNNLHSYVTGCNNFQNGIRAWRFIENSTGSKTGSWGSKFDCTYLCDGSGQNAGYGTDIWGSAGDNAYAVGHLGHVTNPNYAFRVYHSDGSGGFSRITEFDNLPIIADGRNIGYSTITGTASDVWISLGYKLVYNGEMIHLPDCTVEWLEEFEIQLNTPALSADSNFISYQFNLNYDTQKLKFISENLTGTIAEGGSVFANELYPGVVSVSYATTVALSGEGALLNLRFKATDVGKTTLSVSDFLFNNNAKTVAGSVIEINDNTPPTATITLSDEDGQLRFGENQLITVEFSEPMAEYPTPQISLHGAYELINCDLTRESDTVYTYNHSTMNGQGYVSVEITTAQDAHGNDLITQPVGENSFIVIPVNYGDVDDNSYIRAYDAALVLQYSVGMDPLPLIDPLPWENWRYETADTDHSGDVTANDAADILKHTVGLIDMNQPQQSARYKIAPDLADVQVSLLGNEIIFQSAGELYGFNAFVVENTEALGIPDFKNQNMLSAFNSKENFYAVGIATAYSPENGTIFLGIPILKTTIETITIEMYINNTVKTAIIDIPTGVTNLNEFNISISPNPAGRYLYINGMKGVADIYITDLAGKKVISLATDQEQIDVGNLHTGIYFITVRIQNEIVTFKFIKD